MKKLFLGLLLLALAGCNSGTSSQDDSKNNDLVNPENTFLPETTIIAAPSLDSNDPFPIFEFTAIPDNVRFECSVNGGDWTSCASPFNYIVSANGEYVFSVKAVGDEGEEENPPEHRWNYLNVITIGTEGEEIPRDIKATSDNGYILVGHKTEKVPNTANSYYSTEIYVVKLYASLEIEWEKTYSLEGYNNAEGRAVQQTSDGGYIIAAAALDRLSKTQEKPDIALIRIDKNGEVLWTTICGGDQEEGAGDIILTSDGNYLVVGSTRSYGMGEFDEYLIKINDAGEVLWENTYGGEQNDGGWSIVESAGQFLTFGTTSTRDSNNETQSMEVWLRAIDQDGNEVWSESYGVDVFYRVSSLILLEDGFLLTGYYSSTLFGEPAVYTLKTDFDGQIINKNFYTNAAMRVSRDALVAADGGYIISGACKAENGIADVCLMKVDELGQIAWEKSYGGANNESPNAGLLATEDGFLLVGATESFGLGNDDILLVSTDLNGDLK